MGSVGHGTGLAWRVEPGRGRCGDDTGRRFWHQPHGFGIGSIFSGLLQGMSSVPELIFSGVLARHPKMRVLTMETGNTWLVYLLDRVDEKWEKYATEIAAYGVELALQPSEYFKRQCYVTCEGDETGRNTRSI